jgi:hypothetical protein
MKKIQIYPTAEEVIFKAAIPADQTRQRQS